MFFTIPNIKKWKNNKNIWIINLISSLIWIGGLSYIIILAGNTFGCIVKMKSILTGLSILAVGTSLPSLIASLICSRNSQGDMAVSNTNGSTIFGILFALGLPFLIRNLSLG